MGMSITKIWLVEVLGITGVLPADLTLRYFYRKQAAPRPSEQARGAQLALFLRLQRALPMWGLYLGRCPRLYTVGLTARVDREDCPDTSKVTPSFPKVAPLHTRNHRGK